MSTHMRGFKAAAVAIVVALALMPTIASAGLDDPPSAPGTFDPAGNSLTNPNPWSNDGSYVTDWWRQRWGNSLSPQVSWSPPGGGALLGEGVILGQLYVVDRDPSTSIDPATPEGYSRSTYGNLNPTGPYGTNLDNTYDLLGIFAYPPSGGWPSMEPSATSPLEGTWYIHAKYYSSVRYSNLTIHAPIRIDITPPNPVTGFQIAPGVSQPATSGPIPNKRVHLTWDPQEYDKLAGVGYFKILIDDRPLDDKVQGRVYEAPWLPTPHSYTIENFPAGRHKVSVVAVDRATNESPMTSTYFASDPDTPTIVFTSPLNGILNSRTFISVDASDAAGNPMVRFAIDGTRVATFTAPPYSFKPNLTGILPGPHVLSATATDSYGRSVTVTIGATTGSSTPTSVGFRPSNWVDLNSIPPSGTGDFPATGSDTGWLNTLRPELSVNPITPDPDYPEEGVVAGIIYTVDKTLTSTLDISTPEKYYRKTWPESAGALRTQVDLLSILSYPPAGGWPPMNFGERSAAEGTWYFHYVPFTSNGYAGAVTQVIPFKIDITRPAQVTGLVVSPSLNASDAGHWTEGNRAHVSWNIDAYDDLSGMWHYVITVDGEPVDDGIVDGSPGTFTIENMPAGSHAVGVTTVDNAGNEGARASGTFLSDPGVPTISFGSFSREVGTKPTFTVTARDDVGVRSVRYLLDGVHTLGTQTTSPFSISPDLSGFSAGSHQLSAIATDQFGHTARVDTTITLDKTLPTITSFSRTPSIFYPIIRDGYKDRSTLKFRLNKAVTVKLYVRNSKGRTVRTITKSFSAGARSMTWDGKWSSDGKAHTGKFSYQLKATDSVGNTKTSGKLYTIIRDYQLVRVSGSRVKVVPR